MAKTPIDLLTATAMELQVLRGVGPATADCIINLHSTGSFTMVDLVANTKISEATWLDFVASGLVRLPTSAISEETAVKVPQTSSPKHSGLTHASNLRVNDTGDDEDLWDLEQKLVERRMRYEEEIFQKTQEFEAMKCCLYREYW